MKAGFTISSAIHASLLSYALFYVSVSAYEVENKTSVRFESRSAETKQGQDKGKKLAEKTEQVTKRPERNPLDKNVGESNADEKSRKGDITDKPLDTVEATPAPKAAVRQKAKTVSPDPVVNPIKKLIESAPTHEVSEKTEPKVPVQSKPETESFQETAKAEDANIPDLKSVPKPQRATRRPKSNSAKTSERKKEETQVANTETSTRDTKAKKSKPAEKLNFQKDTASGSRSNSGEQSAGASKAKTSHGGLTASEENGVAQAVSEEWIILDTDEYNEMRATVVVRLNRDGSLLGPPRVKNITGPSSLRARFAISVRNAISGAAPFDLPTEKYEGENGWNTIEFNFKPGGDIEAF